MRARAPRCAPGARSTSPIAVRRGLAVRAGGRQHLAGSTGAVTTTSGSPSGSPSSVSTAAPCSRRSIVGADAGLHARSPPRGRPGRGDGPRSPPPRRRRSPRSRRARAASPDCERRRRDHHGHAPSGLRPQPADLHDLGTGALPAAPAPRTRRGPRPGRGREHRRRERCGPPPGRGFVGRRIGRGHVAPPQGAVPVDRRLSSRDSSRSVSSRAGSCLPPRRATEPGPTGGRARQLQVVQGSLSVRICRPTVSHRRSLQMVRSGHSGSNTTDVRLKPDIQANYAGVAGRGRRDRAGPVRGTRITADTVGGRSAVPGQPEDRHQVGARRQAHRHPDPRRAPPVPGVGDPAMPRGDEHGRALTGDASSRTAGRLRPRARSRASSRSRSATTRRTGLRAIIAIHSTVLGPALGGTRFRPVRRPRQDAVADVCRLARGMTYKHAVSGLDCGGGKAVILGDPRDAALRTAAARLRPLRRRPRRPLPDRRGRGHHPGRHGPHPAGDAPRHRGERVARRLGRSRRRRPPGA